MFRSLYKETHFADVTIACKDGKLFETHKVVLATASDIIRDIFVRFSNPHPLLYFGDITSEQLQNILEYAYCGEVLLNETSLENFMEAASKLQIKGLLDMQGPSKDKQDDNAVKSEEDKAYREKFLHNAGCIFSVFNHNIHVSFLNACFC